MTLGLSLTSFSPGTTISSSSMNSNFSAIAAAALPSDSGAISTDGSGKITAAGLVVGSGHILMPNNITLQIKDNGGTARDVLYVDSANATDLQAAVPNGIISFKNQGGGPIAGVNCNNRSFILYDSGNNAHDVVYNSNSDLVIQMINNSNKLYFKDASGNAIGSFDSSGNFRTKGTVTASTTP